MLPTRTSRAMLQTETTPEAPTEVHIPEQLHSRQEATAAHILRAADTVAEEVRVQRTAAAEVHLTEEDKCVEEILI